MQLWGSRIDMPRRWHRSECKPARKFTSHMMFNIKSHPVAASHMLDTLDCFHRWGFKVCAQQQDSKMSLEKMPDLGTKFAAPERLLWLCSARYMFQKRKRFVDRKMISESLAVYSESSTMLHTCPLKLWSVSSAFCHTARRQICQNMQDKVPEVPNDRKFLASTYLIYLQQKLGNMITSIYNTTCVSEFHGIWYLVLPRGIVDMFA